MEDKEKKTDFFEAIKEFDGEILSGLALVAAVGIVASGYGSKLFSGTLNVANIITIVITIVGVMIGALILFYLGATIYSGPLKRLSFIKSSVLRWLILFAFVGLFALFLQNWLVT